MEAVQTGELSRAFEGCFALCVNGAFGNKLGVVAETDDDLAGQSNVSPTIDLTPQTVSRMD
jgi:hypothetical protein